MGNVSQFKKGRLFSRDEESGIPDLILFFREGVSLFFFIGGIVTSHYKEA